MQWFNQLVRKLVQGKMIDLLAPRKLLTDTEPMALVLQGDPALPLPLRILSSLTEEEKFTLVSGVDGFCIPAVPRIGLKAVWTSDATMGLRGWKTAVTDFASTIAMAATFDRDLLYEIGTILGEECRALGVGVLLGPGVNIARVPTCGRNFEYCGEDPYLAGCVAEMYIKGVQSKGVITTVKHFACNNSEYDRHKCNSVVDERSLREIYLPAFKKAIEAGSLGLMTSYNPVNGTYASEHPYLLGEILRQEWGFDGMVVSDWDSLYSTEKVVLNGVDLEMPGAKWLAPEKLKKAIASGSISLGDIDTKLLHIFNAYEKAGLFTRPMVDPKANLGTEAHRSVALKLAREAVVLLKNEEGLLPLEKEKGLVVCVGGRNAFQTPAGGGSSMIQLGEKAETLAQRMQRERVEVVLLPSSWWKKKYYREKVQACGAVVFSTGFDHIYESESYDRQYELPKKEVKELQRLSELTSKLVVILHGGGDLETSSWLSGAKAVLHAMYLGSNTALALTDILFGRCNPSGKLPFTMAKSFSDYRSVSHYPLDYADLSVSRIKGGQGDPEKRSIWDMTYSEGLMVGYRLFDSEHREVAFPFGHGLSYTTFSYSGLQVEKLFDGSVRILFTLTNTGKSEGRETVQVYVHELCPAVYRPEQELKQFATASLGPGDSKEIEIHLQNEAFCHYDIQTWKFVKGDGQFELRIGASSRDIRLKVLV
jgi:beta-glucosidase